MAKILVVDDVAGVRRAISRMLERAGHTVCQAEDGVLGVKAAVQENPDIVLVDMLMPNQDGLETLSQIQSQNLTKYTIAMSGGGMLVGAEEALIQASQSADATVRKPVESDMLLKTINSLMEQAA